MDEEVRNIEDATPEEKAEIFKVIRQAIREGHVKFSDESRAKMKEDDITEDAVIEMLLQQVGLDS